MYEVDEKDRVVELKDIPQSSVGAPIPIILAGEGQTLLIYYLEDFPELKNNRFPKLKGFEEGGEPVAVVKFDSVDAQMFGPPNDEAFDGHPLASRGLEPYGVFEIQDSSWIRKLEKMNSVHPNHYDGIVSNGSKHFIFSFHDTTFECIAEGFEIEVAFGKIQDVASGVLGQIC